jgi:hypothetical protein
VQHELPDTVSARNRPGGGSGVGDIAEDLRERRAMPGVAGMLALQLIDNTRYFVHILIVIPRPGRRAPQSKVV